MQAPENRLRQLLRHGRYRRRPSARGLVHVQGWVTPEQAEAIHRIMMERGEELAEGRRGRERDARNTADRNPTRAPLSHIDAAVTSIHLERREPASNR